ncbi:MAG: TetR/AcrR family transcriptional regulator [Alphaproteobacteria bacterium]|nr:TetR/AcrR family transcriptional regulator [Alphaproteobacteria bacterium]
MPKVVNHDEVRARLLDAGFRLLVEEGYAHATMRRLAAAAGVSTGSLYHYFPDKQAILWELFELTTGRDTERIRATLPPDAPLDDRVRAMFDFYRGERSYLADLLRLVLEVHRHEPAPASRQRVRDAMAAYRDAMASVLALEPGVVGAAFSLLVGNLVQEVVDPSGVDVDAQERLALALAGVLG